MELTVLSKTSAGPVRPKNEDTLAFWEPEDDAEKSRLGSIAVIADGVGGHGNGDLASRMAVDCVLEKFRLTDPDAAPKRVLRELFSLANLALYNAAANDRKSIRMATTLTVCLFRGKELHIGHVGDCRVYLVRHERLEKLTHDHSVTGMHMRLRLMTDHEARVSHLRSQLTRSLGIAPMVRMAYKKVPVFPHDRFVQCSDGLYSYLGDGEICEGVDRLDLDEICSYLVSLAERRGTDDNLSVQLVQVERYSKPPVARPLSILQQPHENHEVHAPSHEVQVGQVLDGRFRIEEVVSRSGMATIFKATDLKEPRTLALKIPHMQFESDVAFFSRFEREAEIGRKLDHPNILRFYDVPKKSRPYIAMELLEGRTLADILNEVKPLPIADAMQIASRICDGLAHMHERGVIHRDLKPANIMICNDSTLRIMDFGIAKAAEMRRITFVGFSPAMGTPDYMAPEQVKGKRGDARTDIYSLGSILYEMTTGRAPFEADNPFMVMNARVTGDAVAPRKLNPAIPPEVEEIILHAMEREPRDRFASAEAMRAQLEDPSLVILTGRHHHLAVPREWKARWHSMRLAVFSGLIPFAIFGLFFLLAHCQRHR